MRLYGGKCPKRTRLVSNSQTVRELGTGKLVRANFPSEVATTVKYRDSKGKLRYKGSSQLKSTQTRSCNLRTWHFHKIQHGCANNVWVLYRTKRFIPLGGLFLWLFSFELSPQSDVIGSSSSKPKPELREYPAAFARHCVQVVETMKAEPSQWTYSVPWMN